MSGHRDFQASTERCAMDRHDYRLGTILDPEKLRQEGQARPVS